MRPLALRTLKFIGLILLAWIVGTLIHAATIYRRGVYCCGPDER